MCSEPQRSGPSDRLTAADTYGRSEIESPSRRVGNHEQAEQHRQRSPPPRYEQGSVSIAEFYLISCKTKTSLTLCQGLLKKHINTQTTCKFFAPCEPRAWLLLSDLGLLVSLFIDCYYRKVIRTSMWLHFKLILIININ